MQLTTEIKKAIDQSVLCWLATVSKEGIPNVSPKEVFNYFEDNSIIVAMEKVLLKITEGKFPFKSITHISIEKVKPIIAPKYILYPDTTEEEQISSALNTYGFNQ